MTSRKCYPFDDPFAEIDKLGARIGTQCRAALAAIAGALIFAVVFLLLMAVLAPDSIRAARGAEVAHPLAADPAGWALLADAGAGPLRGDSVIGLGLLCLAAFLGLTAWRIGRAVKGAQHRSG